MSTAGHIDHGKTALVKALTGMDADRLKEEKQRGITIDIGFAFLKVGHDIELGIIDVPGHEKFVKNMLAGVGGIDVAILVIAADEGIMPQTEEHLAICDLLQIQQGLVAVTKIDLVDEEWLDMVLEDIRGGLKGTFYKMLLLYRFLPKQALAWINCFMNWRRWRFKCKNEAVKGCFVCLLTGCLRLKVLELSSQAL